MKEERMKIAELRDQIREKAKAENENMDIREIHYLKEFQIINETEKYMGYNENDIFIVEKNKKDIKYYDIYNKDMERLASTEEEGVLKIDESYKEKLKENLKDFYPQLGLEDEKRKMFLHEIQYVQEKNGQQQYFSKEKGFIINDKSKEEITKEENEEQIKDVREKRQNNIDIIDTTLIEEDLGLNEKDIGSVIQIKDKVFYEKVPEAKKYDGNAMLAYCKATNSFIVMGLKNGKYEMCESIEPSVGTMKTSVDLDRRGENIEKQAIGGIMKLKENNEYDFAVNIEPGGVIEFQELRMDNHGKYMSADLCIQGQTQTSWEVEKMMDKGKNRLIDDEMEEFKNEQKHDEAVTVGSLDEKNCTKEEKSGQLHNERLKDEEDEYERTPYNRRHY